MLGLSREMGRNEDYYSPTYKPKHGHEKKLGFSLYLVIFAISFGVLLVLLNAYQLYNLSRRTFGDSPQVQQAKKVVWLYAKKNSHLKHVTRIFSFAGYTVMTSLTPPERWDVMWAYEFPFQKDFIPMLSNLHYDQKVNHFPGTGYITLKVDLAKTKLRWIPQAFSIPNEKEQFLLEAEQNPKKLWVQKSNNHRGIKIINSKEVDLEAKDTFIQEFIANPLLIDEKKFDIGIYVVYTSVDPLQVYMYEDEILVRFCTEVYPPLDVSNVHKYVVGDEYTSVSEMPSLSTDYNGGKMTFKDTLFAHMKAIGYDPSKIMEEVRKCIAEVFLAKTEQMTNAFRNYQTKHNFFELVRFDFVIDDAGNLWLMEINMSPNLSSDTHPMNAYMYQQVVYHTLALTGVATHIDERFSIDAKEISANERSIIIPNSKCKSYECLTACSSEECQLCSHCLSDVTKALLKKAYKEHHNKGGFTRVLPLPSKTNGEVLNVNTYIKRPSDLLLASWFKGKCLQQASWCQ